MGLGAQAKAALGKIFTNAGPRPQRARLCVSCNGIIGAQDEECPHCHVRQTVARKAVRAVRVAMPGPVSTTTILLASYVILHLIPVLFFSETASFTKSGYLIDGDSTRRVIANAHVLMGANNDHLLADGQWWRLVTATFLHIGLMHIVFNGYALFVLGRPTEGLYGWGWFISMYLVSGVIGNVLSWQMGGFAGGLQAGASGSIFGLIGIGIVHCWRHRWANRAMLRMLLMWGGLSLGFGFFIGADNWAHVGGLVSGGAMAWLMPAERVCHRKYRWLARTAGAISVVVIVVSFGFALDSALEFIEVMRSVGLSN